MYELIEIRNTATHNFEPYFEMLLILFFLMFFIMNGMKLFIFTNNKLRNNFKIPAFPMLANLYYYECAHPLKQLLWKIDWLILGHE